MAKQLQIMDGDKISAEVLSLILDPSVHNRYPSLKTYLSTQKIKVEPKSLSKLISICDAEIIEQIRYLSLLLYHIFTLSNDWGDAGEEQIKISYCRNFLGIDPDKTLTQDDAFRFMMEIEEAITKAGLRTLALKPAQDTYKEYSFHFLGKKYPYYDLSKIDRLLRFVGSSLFAHSGYHGDYIQYLLGEGDMEHIGPFDVVTLNREVVRSPNVIVSLAAVIGDREIFIRREALVTIFYQKWMPVLELGPADRAHIQKEDVRNISEGIKRRTLSLYQVKTKDDLLNVRETFLSEMKETILCHELGHGVLQHDLMPMEDIACAEATKAYGETIFTALLEFLADFAPTHAGIRGPIQNMIDISKQDKRRATRMYYMYFSDVWFFDTEDTYMYLYSDVMALILLKYINTDGSVDFAKLEEDIRFDSPHVQKDTLTMVGRIVELISWGGQEVKTIVSSAKFSLVGGDYDYQYVKKLTYQNFRDNKVVIDEASYKFVMKYWMCLVKYAKVFSAENGKKLETYLQDLERKTMMKIMILSAGRKTAEAYQYDHRAFIMARMKELGIVAFKATSKAKPAASAS